MSSTNDEQSERDLLANTVYSLFIPLREGETDIEPDIRPVRSERFGVDVLPGHPALSNIEDVMSDVWQSSLAKKTGDFRRIHWAGQLAVAMEDEDRYDYIFYDVGPSLGPFNRTVLLVCDAFVTPTSTDLFSFHVFGNLAKWFNDWVTEYSEISEGNLAQWRNYSPDISKKTRKLRLLGHDGRGLQYLGYTTLEYVKRRSNGKEQLVGAFERFRGKFDDEAKRIGDSLGHSCDHYLIGHVPHMYSVPTAAQDSHSPIADLQATDGVRGTQLNQRTGYAEKIDEVAALVLERLES
ncbi:ParA family protein [Corynebacterium amycolatum]|uniref:ParA family protein n=1 Tax=Corynebacterium amycolatum TaxID=43765 RepID=UPI001FCB3809|nr:ParA family protein [Corynebacterium amycolatum]